MKVELARVGKTIPGSSIGQQWTMNILRSIKKFSTSKVPIYFKSLEGAKVCIGETKSLSIEQGVLYADIVVDMQVWVHEAPHEWAILAGRYGSLRELQVFEKGEEVNGG